MISSILSTMLFLSLTTELFFADKNVSIKIGKKYCEMNVIDGGNAVRKARGHKAEIFARPVFFIESERDLDGIYIDSNEWNPDECPLKDLPVSKWTLEMDEVKNEQQGQAYQYKFGEESADNVLVTNGEEKSANTKGLMKRIDSFKDLAKSVFMKKNVWITFISSSETTTSSNGINVNNKCPKIEIHMPTGGSTDTGIGLYACSKRICHERTLFLFNKNFRNTKQTGLKILLPGQSELSKKRWEKMWKWVTTQECVQGVLGIEKAVIQQQRIVNVSNAPPVKFVHTDSGMQITGGSGGLVTCVEPMMATNARNIWLFSHVIAENDIASSSANNSPRGSSPKDQSSSNVTVKQSPLPKSKSSLKLSSIVNENAKDDEPSPSKKMHESYSSGNLSSMASTSAITDEIANEQSSPRLNSKKASYFSRLNVLLPKLSLPTLSPSESPTKLSSPRGENGIVKFKKWASSNNRASFNKSRANAKSQVIALFKEHSEKCHYTMRPIFVKENDFNAYYGDISNGLLWPALHGMPEFILPIFNDQSMLEKDWRAYVRVNRQFAIETLEAAQPGDFIWVHDYHLMLTGKFIQQQEKDVEMGFFMHTPFQLPKTNFLDNKRYASKTRFILESMLAFSKLGFQLRRDLNRFVDLVETYLSNVKVEYPKNGEQNLVKIFYKAGRPPCCLGVFPVCLKKQDFVEIAESEVVKMKALEIRKKIFGPNPSDDICLFFSAERFDYTKGIKDKLKAFERHLERHGERRGKDVLFQVAIENRQNLETYRVYQKECTEIAENINKKYQNEKLHPGWKPIIFKTKGFDRPDLVANYLAMDVGVVSPIMDGMNLVVKEMLLSNPKAGLILSVGAGVESQFSDANLYENVKENGKRNYHRVEDVTNLDEFANILHAAAMESKMARSKHGNVLNEFIRSDCNIERWSEQFLDFPFRKILRTCQNGKCAPSTAVDNNQLTSEQLK